MMEDEQATVESEEEAAIVVVDEKESKHKVLNSTVDLEGN
jgi:hypothetical protein